MCEKTSFLGTPSGNGNTSNNSSAFSSSRAGNRSWSSCTCQDSHQADDDDTDQRMLQVDFGTRVLEILKVPHDIVDLTLLHHDSNLRGRNETIRRKVIANQTPWRNSIHIAYPSQNARGPAPHPRATGLVPLPYPRSAAGIGPARSIRKVRDARIARESTRTVRPGLNLAMPSNIGSGM